MFKVNRSIYVQNQTGKGLEKKRANIRCNRNSMEMYNFHTHYTLHVTSVLCEYNNREGEVKELILNVESGSITGVTCGRRDAL